MGSVATADEQMRRLCQRGARDRLADRDRYRLVIDAYKLGLTQRRISGCLGTLSQATITRMLQHAAANPDLIRETPEEIIDRYVADDISSEEMMSRLRTWPFIFADAGAIGDRAADGASTTSDWLDVERAFRRGLLSDEQFRALANRDGMPTSVG